VKAIGKAGHLRWKIDHAIGIGIGERLEQNRIHNREDGGVGSDAQRQAGNGCDGKSGRLREYSHSMLHIAYESPHPSPP
jgi:hypothetical protein